MTFFLPRADLSISSHQFQPHSLSPKEWMKQKEAYFSSKTMGCLSRMFCERILKPVIQYTEMEESSRGDVRLNISIRMLDAGGERSGWDQRLQLVVEKRNRLVHQLFRTFDLNSSEGVKKLELFLDEQYQESRSILEDLQRMHESLREFSDLLKTNSLSIVSNGCLDFPFVQVLVVVVLWLPYVSGILSEEGWCSLARAGAYLSKYPEAVAKCRNKFGTSSLKKILEKTELFDIRGESTQVFYRLKQEFMMEVDHEGGVQFSKRHSDPSGFDWIVKQEFEIILTDDASRISAQILQ